MTLEKNKQKTTATTGTIKTKASEKKQNKTKKKQKQKAATTEKWYPPKPNPFPKDFSQVVYLFLCRKSVY